MMANDSGKVYAFDRMDEILAMKEKLDEAAV
jgi:hypothetical protein